MLKCLTFICFSMGLAVTGSSHTIGVPIVIHGGITSFPKLVGDTPVCPIIYTVGGGGTYCGPTGYITLSDSQIGASYTLLNNGVNTGISQSSPDGGGLGFTGIATSGTYTIQANLSGCLKMMSGSAVVSINPEPGVPIVNDLNICSGTPTILSGTPGSNGNTIQWYNSSWTYLGTGTSFTASNQSTAATYYARSYNTSTTCLSTTYGTINTTIVQPPTAWPIGGGSACTGSSMPSVILKCVGAPPYTIVYSNGTSNTTVSNNSSYTITNPAVGTYSLVSVQDNSGCYATSLGGSVNVSALPLPTGTTSGGGAVCLGNAMPTVGFNFTGATPFQFSYTDGTTTFGPTSVSGTSYSKTSAPAGSYRITALSDNNGCSANNLPTATTNVVVNPLPPQPFDASVAGWTLGTGSVLLSALATQPGDILHWYASVSGGTSLQTGSNYTASGVNSDLTFYVDETDALGCISNRTGILAKYFAAISPNSVRQEAIRTGGITQDNQISALTTSQKTTKISFMDGLSRTNQVQGLQTSPSGKDVIQPIQYDQYGRSPKAFLPYTKTSAGGIFSTTFSADQLSFYNAPSDKVADDSAPFSIAAYEDSPLGRMKEQGGAGAAWVDAQGPSDSALYRVSTNR